MKINVLLSPSEADELFFTGKRTVVIDVLRATTVIPVALQNGAKEVIPVNSVEHAVKLSSYGGQVLLGGERNTKKIDGFHLGNSPLEYNKKTVEGKTIVLFTTNGSKAIVKAKFSESIFICSFVNIHSIINQLADNNDKDIIIVCSGKEGTFCIEDTICAGKLIKELIAKKNEYELNDPAKASIVLGKHYGKDLFKSLSECDHGQLLIKNGFEEDIKFCAQVDTVDILPSFSNNTIKIHNTPSVTGKK